MKKILSMVLITSLIISLCACSKSDEFSDSETISKKSTRDTDQTKTFNYSDGVIEPPTTYVNYANQITDFELRLFRNYSKSNYKNSSFSLAPINTALTLGELSNGATKDTQQEIINALGKDLTLEIINQCSSYFKSRIESVSEQSVNATDGLSSNAKKTSTSYVKLKNNFYINDNCNIKTSFLQTNADFFGNEIFRFNYDDGNAIAKVNNSVKDVFDGNAVQSIDTKQKMFTLSGADICDVWLNAYAKDEVSQGIFNSDGKDKTVNFITSNENYIHTSKATGIIKYTKSTPLKFIAVMPNENISINEYINNFNALEYSNLLDSMDLKSKASAKLPEFSIDEKSTKNLTDSITSSGLYTAFTDSATFLNLSNDNSFMINSINEVQPKISFNAGGLGGQTTNGNTPAIEKRTTKLEKTNKSVEFNRPFIFLVVDNESNIPLYLGVVDL